ncbi:MAG TPA: hypothetical protein VN426_17005 [Syntrophomonadaceae bacterium]|nr:hypothetical protein [Syntrophomonadaceae bacterium]
MEQEKRINKRILLVDDDPLVISAYRRNLHSDYEVLTATSGLEGLEILGQESPVSLFLISVCRVWMEFNS